MVLNDNLCSPTELFRHKTLISRKKVHTVYGQSDGTKKYTKLIWENNAGTS